MSHRTTAALLLVCTLGLLAGSAAASPATPPAKKGVPRLVFPVIGESAYTDDFGDARGQGSHEGNDIMAPRRAVAVAAESGVVRFHTTSSRAGCMLYLDGQSGTQYLYIHLNNDLTAANDNRGKCVAGVAYAAGLKDGARVERGQAIAFVGDSGDADGGSPHLHFEVHPNGGGAVNPYKHLQKAYRLLFAATPGQTFTLALSGKVVDATFDGQLELKVETLRKFPNHPKVKLDRDLSVYVPESATIERSNPVAGLLPTVAKLTGVKPGEKASVWTEPAKATLQAQLGAGLSAQRVLLKP